MHWLNFYRELMWVGYICPKGIEVSSTIFHRRLRPESADPTWKCTNPGLPESIPPTLASEITRTSSSKLGQDDR